MPDVFLSHSTQDNDFTRFLADYLDQEGFDVWVDFDDISSGERWVKAIQQAIEDCAAMVIVLSKASRDSEWCEREALLAMNLKKPVHVALIEDLPLPLHLINRQYTDFRTDQPQAAGQLAAALRELDLEAAAPRRADQPRPLSPLPTEQNFFDYLAQLPGAEHNSLVARDLYQWAQEHADCVEFGGKITPGFHVKALVGDTEITVFSLWAYPRRPAVQVQFQYLMNYAPYTDAGLRRSTLESLSRLMDEPFINDKAQRRPTLRLSHAFKSAHALEAFKQVMAEIIDNLKSV